MQKRPAKDALKIAVHLSNPRGRTWTARDQFSAPFAVVRQYDTAGNTVVNSCLNIRNNDDRDFSPKMSFIRTIFREFGCVVNPLGRTEPPHKKVALEQLGGEFMVYVIGHVTDDDKHTSSI